MNGPSALAIVKDAEGSVSFGWVGDGVLYSRFSEALSAELGVQHATRIQGLVQRAPSVRYFVDASALTQYDLLARSAFVRVVLANRRKFSTLALLTWAEGSVRATQTFAAMLGDPVQVFEDPSEFDELLLKAAPYAPRRTSQRSWDRSFSRSR